MSEQTPVQERRKQPKDKLLPKLTIAFFDRPLLTAVIWLSLLVFGVFCYTTLLRREGFPSVNIPLTVITGNYFVNDPAKVDSQLAKPISDIALAQDTTKSVQAQSSGNFFSATVQYKEGTNVTTAADNLKKAVESSGKLPKAAQIQYSAPYFGATGGDSQQIDVAVSLFDTSNRATTTQLADKAQAAAQWLNDQHLAHVKAVFVKSPFAQATDPKTGKPQTVQRSFDRYDVRQNNATDFYNSVIIGVSADQGSDVIKLDKMVNTALSQLQQQPQFRGYQAVISASFAPSITANLSELQRVLLEGLLAILVVGSIVIAIRASIITVVSMITVLLSTLGFLYLIHYTLNVITLFALILGLALIVDDTIIMVEAIDAARRNQTDRRQVVLGATRKISRAMVAATATAALSFTPLLFVSGVLGSFIRAIPVTLVAALIISLLVALIFIPFIARFLLLGKKQLGQEGVKEMAAGFEAALARFITRPMVWARQSRVRLATVIILAVVVGFGFFGAGLLVARNVVFNIFPPTKDTDGIAISLQFPAGTTIQQAGAIAAQADKLAADDLGQLFVHGSYYASGNAQTATLQIQLVHYSKRNVKSPQLVKQLQDRFKSNFKAAKVAIFQLDVGPPASTFNIQIKTDNRSAAYKLASDLEAYLSSAELKRLNGQVARFTNVSVSSPSQYLRTAGNPIVVVSSGFDGTDTTTLVNLAQTAVKQQFPDSKLGQYGLSSGALSFDIGQESENQNSFKTLALAFPVLLVVIYILLSFQFRSLLQPLLIFLAIPFSIFGVMLGLDLTHNAISFFSMLGFFALIGLSIKNTILLTDYANQARRQGHDPIDSAVEALRERFRPLFATSLTAVVSLIPLAITSPFWQSLAVVLIFGLLCSTLLVVTVFPYYYLGAEFLRQKISFVIFMIWLVPLVLIEIGMAHEANTKFALLMLPLLSIALMVLISARRLWLPDRKTG